MKKFIISYAPSTSYAISQTYLKPRKTKYSYAGFAPEYNSITSSGDMYSHLQDLPFARESVASIAKLLDGQSYISSRATVGGFKAEAPKANIIHLAMHGLIDPETPLLSKLIFGGNKTQNVLSTSDLLDINFNAKLAVLSACNTGVGKIVNGDGIQNIARSFAFAGIENIIMSLWSIPDVQTAALEKKFFDGIMLKQNVDLALHNAKLDYLTECTELRASPFYWAGFIASGEMSAIELPADGIPFTVILLCSLVFLAVIYGFMSGSKKTNSTNMN